MTLKWCTESEVEETSVEENRRTHLRRFKAKTDVNDTYEAILHGRPDLARHQIHPTDDAARVIRFNPVRAALGYWDISVEYSTEVQGDNKDNPLDRPAEITIDNQPREKIRLRDAKGRPVVNAAGDLFDDPPPTISVNNLVFVIEKNIPTAFPDWILTYRNAVNVDAVRLKGRTLPPNSLQIQKLTIGADQIENDVDFCRLHLEIEHDPDGWTKYIPNRGFFQLVYDPREKDRFKKYRRPAKKEILIDGAQPREPQWLDKVGQWIEEPWNNINSLVFLPFDLSDQLPFNRLPLR